MALSGGSAFKGWFQGWFLAGEFGQSLSICLAGKKAGVWKDHAIGESGSNLLELLRASRGGPFASACREARGWLQWPENKVVARPDRPTSKPDARIDEPDQPYVLTPAERRWGNSMA